MTYKEYITSKEWYQIKIDLIQLRGCKCEMCGSKRPATVLHIHHLTYERIFNELPEDLIIVCPVCHMKEHGLIKERKRTVKKRKVKNNSAKIEKNYLSGKYKTYDQYLKAKKKAKTSNLKPK